MHLAIIMDGNGRWAQQRGLPRVEGHRRGAEVVREITTYCAHREDVGILTLFAFSTENWRRPKREVEFLFWLLERYLRQELKTYLQNGVQFKAIGRLEGFPRGLRQLISEVEAKTAGGERLLQVLALNYGGRDELFRAAERLCRKGGPFTVQELEAQLDLPTEVDLLIRTSGELRLSNFLLWQAAYAELYFTETFWPDFTPRELEGIIENFYSRERRFGGLEGKRGGSLL
ncbi:MAG: polyprenyl diphosphate synthase [Campylobacterales bacterium]